MIRLGTSSSEGLTLLNQLSLLLHVYTNIWIPYSHFILVKDFQSVASNYTGKAVLLLIVQVRILGTNQSNYKLTNTWNYF